MGRKKSTAELLGQLTKAADRVKIPKLADMAAEFINQLGGAEQLAVQMVSDYNASAPGSMTRAKILDLVLRGLKDGDVGQTDISQHSTADLDRLLKLKLTELESDRNGRIAGPAAQPAEAEGASPGSKGEAKEANGSPEESPPEPDPAAVGPAADDAPAAPPGPGDDGRHPEPVPGADPGRADSQ